MDSFSTKTIKDSATTSGLADTPVASSSQLPSLKSALGMGPYAVDACCLIPQELIQCKPSDPFS